MVNAADNILNFVIGIILIVGGIVSTLVAIYPRLSFDETSRYVEPDGNATAMSESLVQPNESKLFWKNVQLCWLEMAPLLSKYF